MYVYCLVASYIVHDEHQKVHKKGSAYLRLGITLGFPVTCADDTTAEPRLNFSESLTRMAGYGV